MFSPIPRARLSKPRPRRAWPSSSRELPAWPLKSATHTRCRMVAAISRPEPRTWYLSNLEPHDLPAWPATGIRRGRQQQRLRTSLTVPALLIVQVKWTICRKTSGRRTKHAMLHSAVAPTDTPAAHPAASFVRGSEHARGETAANGLPSPLSASSPPSGHCGA